MGLSNWFILPTGAQWYGASYHLFPPEKKLKKYPVKSQPNSFLNVFFSKALNFVPFFWYEEIPPSPHPSAIPIPVMWNHALQLSRTSMLTAQGIDASNPEKNRRPKQGSDTPPIRMSRCCIRDDPFKDGLPVGFSLWFLLVPMVMVGVLSPKDIGWLGPDPFLADKNMA